MATFKCDIKQQFGKYQAWAWKANTAQGDALAAGLGDPKVATEQVIDALKKSGFAEGDEVIFRSVAYSSLVDLRTVLSRAPY